MPLIISLNDIEKQQCVNYTDKLYLFLLQLFHFYYTKLAC